MKGTINLANWLIVVSFLAVASFGVLMIMSVTYFGKEGSQFWGFVLKQVLGILVGGSLGIALTRFRLSDLAVNYLLPFVMFGLVFSPVFFGSEIQGAYRWINLGLFNFQPGELAKVLFVIYLSFFWGKVRDGLSNYVGPTFVFVGLQFAFYLQRDLGSMVLVGIIFLTGLVFVVRHFLIPIGGGVLLTVVFAFAIVLEPYRLARLKTFLNPEADPLGAGYQLNQSLRAFEQGGIWGKGIGMSSQKISSLPASHTDFIFSIIGEELGLLGCLFVLLALSVLSFGFLYRGLYFSGIRRLALVNVLSFAVLFSHTFLNVMVTMGALPTKGIPLPLISYGGSQAMAFTLLVTYALLLRWL